VWFTYPTASEVSLAPLTPEAPPAVDCSPCNGIRTATDIS